MRPSTKARKWDLHAELQLDFYSSSIHLYRFEHLLRSRPPLYFMATQRPTPERARVAREDFKPPAGAARFAPSLRPFPPLSYKRQACTTGWVRVQSLVELPDRCSGSRQRHPLKVKTSRWKRASLSPVCDLRLTLSSPHI